MSNYSKTTDFEAKDSLPTGDSGKIIRGAEFETEFDAISTAIATKADTAGPTFTGTLTFETISDGTIGVTAFVDEDDMSSDSATLVPTQQSVKAYVDSQVTAQDLDFQADSGGALSIDLDSETMTFTGGTGIDTSGLGNAVTFAIDSTVATLTGTQTLTNKTLTSPDVNTPDIDGGTIDGTVIGGTTPAAVSATTVSATGNITVNGTVDGRDVATDGAKLDGIESGATADQTAAEIRTLVEAATDSNVFTDADHSKLNGIEALADVTDTANVTAAGALMDSELTSIASVKALNQGVATTDSPTFAAVTVNGNVEFDGLSGTGSVTVTDILDQDDMSSNSATALATQQSIKAYVDSQVATVDTLAEVLGNGNTTGGTDIVFGDNDKAIFGVSGDLQIYHDGSNSYIKDLGTGDLFLSGNTGVQIQSDAGENMITTAANGAVSLFYDASAKLATTSTGIDVTGTATVDALTSSGTIKAETAFGGFLTLKRNDTTLTNNADIGSINFEQTDSDDAGVPVNILASGDGSAGGGKLRFYTGTPTSRAQRQTIYSNGDVEFYEDTGTTAKLFWDASAESLGIGTSSPDAPFTIQRPSNNQGIAAGLSLKGQDGTTQGGLGTDGVNDNAVQLVAAQFIKFHTSNTDGTANERMRIDSSGNVGIGTDSPSTYDSRANNLVVGDSGDAGITIFSGASNDARLQFAPSGDTGLNNGLIGYDNANDKMSFATAGSDRMYIDSSGRVGVGVTPKSWLTSVNVIDVGTSAAAYYSGGVTHNAYFDNTNNRWEYKGTGAATFYNIQGGTHIWSYAASGTADNPITFNEAMRIDTSGNLLVGKSVSSFNTAGIEARAGGTLWATADGTNAASFNRKTSDGDIALFSKDGTTVGSIGTETSNSDLYIGNGDTAIMFHDGVDAIFPHNASTNASRDAAIDIGYSTYRFKDLYLSGGVFSGGQFSAGTTGNNVFFAEGSQHIFRKGSAGSYAEFGRFDPSGNLLVGKTSLNDNLAGFQTSPSGETRITRSGGLTLALNRQTSDGEILGFRKDGTAVGSIGTYFGDLTIGTGNCGLIFNDGTEIIIPANITTNAVSDAAVDLGYSAGRFKDLYLSGKAQADTYQFAQNSAASGATEAIYRPTTGQMAFKTNSAERMRIDSSGNLLVGLTSSNYLAADDGIQLNANGTARFGGSGTSARNLLSFVNGTDGTPAEVGFIQTNGSATSYSTSSDQRLKENIVDAPSASDDIDAIQVRSFDWKADGSHQKYGMVAQELQSVAPEAVSGDADSDDMMGVDYSKLVPMLVKEIQSLRARVAQLEGEN